MKKNIKLLMLVVLTLFVINVSGCNNMNSNANTNNDNKIPFYSTEEELLEIETKYCILHYPLEWKEYVYIDIENTNPYSICFFAKVENEKIPLFSLLFNGNEGDAIGSFHVENEIVVLNVLSYELPKNEYSDDMLMVINEMNEDLNVIISKLIENYDFKIK